MCIDICSYAIGWCFVPTYSRMIHPLKYQFWWIFGLTWNQSIEHTWFFDGLNPIDSSPTSDGYPPVIKHCNMYIYIYNIWENHPFSSMIFPFKCLCSLGIHYQRSSLGRHPGWVPPTPLGRCFLVRTHWCQTPPGSDFMESMPGLWWEIPSGNLAHMATIDGSIFGQYWAHFFQVPKFDPYY